MERNYHRGEKGLETLERQMIESAKMVRLLSKLSKYFNVEFTKPTFRPVFINKRLKAVRAKKKSAKQVDNILRQPCP